ncbi:MAG: DUF4382 domain-containing protein [bacterium]
MGWLKRLGMIIFTAFLLVALTGCGGEEDSTGLLSLGLTDAPLDGASRVMVQFTGIEIQPASGERLTYDFEESQQIDLLALNGGGRELLLESQLLPAGHYTWIRLKVKAEPGVLDSYLEFADSNSVYSLYIPSGSETGLKLVRGFYVPAGGMADFTIDFDLRKSVHAPSDGNEDYFLRPTLRIVDNTEVGSIGGVISPALITNLNEPPCTVYIFEGIDVIPDDIDGVDPEPITVAEVTYNEETEEYSYLAAFLNAGDYTIALTCRASEDDPGDDPFLDDQISFGEPAQVTVTAGTVIEYDFE